MIAGVKGTRDLLPPETRAWNRVEATAHEVFALYGFDEIRTPTLGRGMLTGEIKAPESLAEDDARKAHPRFQAENFEHNRHLVEELEKHAAGLGITAAQLALAWVLARRENIVPIPGTKRRKWLEQDLGALDITLTREVNTALEELFTPGAVQGERYHAYAMQAVNR